MVDQLERARLMASRSAALAAKDAFTSKYAAGRGDRAVGIGINRNGNDWAVKVFAQTRAAARELPSQFEDFDVEVQVTGAAEAF